MNVNKVKNLKKKNSSNLKFPISNDGNTTIKCYTSSESEGKKSPSTGNSEISITTSSDCNILDKSSDSDKRINRLRVDEYRFHGKCHSDNDERDKSLLGSDLLNIPRRSNSARFIRHKSNATSDCCTEEPPFLCKAITSHRPRCDTDPSVFKRPRPGVLDSLIRQTVTITTGQLGLDLGSQPPSLGPVEPPHSDSEDVPLDYIG